MTARWIMTVVSPGSNLWILCLSDAVWLVQLGSSHGVVLRFPELAMCLGQTFSLRYSSGELAGFKHEGRHHRQKMTKVYKSKECKRADYSRLK